METTLMPSLVGPTQCIAHTCLVMVTEIHGDMAGTLAGITVGTITMDITIHGTGGVVTAMAMVDMDMGIATAIIMAGTMATGMVVVTAVAITQAVVEVQLIHKKEFTTQEV